MKRWILLLTVAALLLACFTGCGNESAKAPETSGIPQTTKGNTAGESETNNDPCGRYVFHLTQNWLNNLPGSAGRSDMAGAFGVYLSNFGSIEYVLELNRDMTFEYGFELDRDDLIEAYMLYFAEQNNTTYDEIWNQWIQEYGSKEEVIRAFRRDFSDSLMYSGTYTVSGNTIRCECDGEVLSFTYDGNSVSIADQGIGVTFVRQ